MLVGRDGAGRLVGDEAGHRAQAAIEDVYRVAGTHHQPLIVAWDHCHVLQVYEQLLGKVERHSRQAAAALAGSLPALRPQRAHRGRRTVLQLQQPQQVRRQITREQHSLDQPLRQRLLRGEDVFGLAHDFG